MGRDHSEAWSSEESGVFVVTREEARCSGSYARAKARAATSRRPGESEQIPGTWRDGIERAEVSALRFGTSTSRGN